VQEEIKMQRKEGKMGEGNTEFQTYVTNRMINGVEAGTGV
jgi:hypothetical protein